MNDRAESVPKMTVVPPAAESLLHFNDPNCPWPEEIKNDPEIRKQAETRRALSSKLEFFSQKIPRADMDIKNALSENLITEKDAAELYTSLSDLLEQDRENNRIVLYLPFEFLPSSKTSYQSAELTEASGRFSRIFKKEWVALLSARDLRADFIDGDIPEPEYRDGPLPRVVKAAHLLPKLVEKGLVSAEEINDLIKNTEDKILKQSLEETLPVLRDMKLIDGDSEEETADAKNEDAGADLPMIIAQAEKDRENISVRYEKNDARNKWLKQEALRHSNEEYGHRISLAISQGTIPSGELEKFLSPKGSEQDTLVVIRALEETLETIARESSEQAASHYRQYEPSLFELRTNNASADINDAIDKMLYHLFALGAVDTAAMEKFGISPPALHSPVSEKLNGMQDAIAAMNEIVKKAETDPELSKMIYPVALLLGSQIKGYAKRNADLDTAVFVRPGIEFAERSKLQELIRKTFVHEKITGQSMEFWTKEEKGELSIQDFENPDTALGDSTLAHPLLGAWCGDSAAIKELYERLLPNYLYSKGKAILGKSAQRVWLEEMEHNLLQYRLMHKGYSRYHPEQGGIRTACSNEIDSESAFYDSGYRRLATQLFVNRIFLPQIEKPAKKPGSLGYPGLSHKVTTN